MMRLSRLVSCLGRLCRLGGGLVLLGGLAALPAHAQEAGAGAFSRMGFGARGIALGNALVADPSANVSPHYNPALLPAASGQRLAASAALLSFDRELQFLEFTAPLGPTAGIGLSLTHAGTQNIDARTADGVRTGTLSTDEFALSLAFGNRFGERVSVGTALTIYQSDLVPDVDPARGFGVDLGVGVRATDRLFVAAAVHDLLAQYEWDASSVGGGGYTDEFPVQVRVGASYAMLEGQLRVLGEVESRTLARERAVPTVVITSGGPQQRSRTESFRQHSVQGRLGIAGRPVEILAVRAGLDRIGVDGTEGLRPSGGLGVRQSLGNLDLRLSYTATLEPYVRTVMSTGTVELFL